jgi:hypothetical protein
MLNIDFTALAAQICPPFLRLPVHLSFREVIVSQHQWLHDTAFLPFVEKTRRELSYNGQTKILEWALNNEFDPDTDTDSMRRIYILNNDTDLTPFFLYSKAEYDAGPPPVKRYLYRKDEYDLGPPPAPQYLFNYAEYVLPIGFQVFVPTDLADMETAIRAFINRYKYACTTYEIIYL